MKSCLLTIFIALIAALLVSCGGGGGGGGGGTSSSSGSTYTIGGSISGLSGQVTLLNNGADPLIVKANGSFTFATPVANNGSYAVTVGTQPTGQTCTVTSGSGAGVVANITNVSVVCSTITYTIGGSISGLNGQVTLLNNGADALIVKANGSFTFATPIAYNGSYAVTVGTQPTGQTCSIANNTGSGTNVIGNINNVSVVCSATTYSLSGTGLVGQVTLFNNLADAKTITANGAFTFPTPIANGGSYLVTVGTQPTGQVCSVALGSGINVTANVSTVSVTCATATGGTFPVQNAMKAYWGSGSAVIFNSISGTETVNSVGYAITGILTYSNGIATATTFNGVSAYQVIETTSGYLYVNGTNNKTYQQGILNYYLNSQYAPIGLVSAGNYCVASTVSTYPTTALIAQNGSIAIYSCYTDVTKATLLGTTSFTYQTSAGPSGTLNFDVYEYDYDTAHNLLQTAGQRYIIPISGTASLVQSYVSYTVNAGTPSTPATVVINFL